MSVPKFLFVFVAICIAAGVLVPILDVYTKAELPGSLAVAVSLMNLGIFTVFAYFNYRLAKEPYKPVATFHLKQFPSDPLHINFVLQNHSRSSLQCWTRLNPVVDDTPVQMGDFYGGESPFNLQPLNIGWGHFDIRNILTRAGTSIEEIKARAQSEDTGVLLRFNIEFGYNLANQETLWDTFKQPYCYDFKRDSLYLDY